MLTGDGIVDSPSGLSWELWCPRPIARRENYVLKAVVVEPDHEEEGVDSIIERAR